ncbi:MAG: UDP-N-acetylglucosamine--N-acetylmuramyl-(pentapeptide) pyrophosphoryl-undecaprenol N-acetylglucosamine transferase [Phycisphaerales bacterium JB059]
MALGVVFMGGGSGGHLYPALAIAERVRDEAPDARFLFLCSQRDIDARILDAQGAEFVQVPARPPGRSPGALIRFMRSWGPSVRAARGVIQQLKREERTVVPVAMGGFVAAPCVMGARAEKLDVLMTNLDAVPGMANRWIARRAHTIVTAAPVEGRDWTRIPPVVRRAAVPNDPPGVCRERFGLDPDAPTLLVTGGSQGARTLNELATAIASATPTALRAWQVIHQTGRDADPNIPGAYERAGVRAWVGAFIEDMASAWGAADLAIARSGAGSVAEAWSSATPCIFLPYPYHRDQHQRRNALPLVEAGACVLIEDRLDPARTLEGSSGEIADLLASAQRRDAMRAGFATLGPADGAERLARMLLDRANA